MTTDPSQQPSQLETYRRHWTSIWFIGTLAIFVAGEAVVISKGYSLQWQWILIYFIVMIALSPAAHSGFSFFKGGIKDDAKDGQSAVLLGSSAFISWVFAKSVYNSSVLGAEFGIMGGFAYACYYISFFSVATVVCRLRRLGYESLPEVINHKYGPSACIAFFCAVLFRLFQEVWSNATVVAGFYGTYDTPQWWAAAILSSCIPLCYVMLGGMRSSLVSDVLQAVLAVAFLTGVLAVIKSLSNDLNCSSAEFNNCNLMTWNPVPGRKKFSLEGGLDLALTGLLQGGLSYGFFDPVLTDRAFLADPNNMRRAYYVGGTVAAIFILFFSLLGVYGNMLAQLDRDPADADYAGLLAGHPADVARSVGMGFFSIVNLVFLTSSVSTLDSTFASTAKLCGLEGINFFLTGRPRTPGEATSRDVLAGRIAIVFIAIVGTLPLLQNPKALNATTISGTVILGLGPPILFAEFVKGYRPLLFHASFWCGVCIGVLYQLSVSRPDLVDIDWLEIGNGSYAKLLGTNVVGSALAFGLFGLCWFENRNGEDFPSAASRRWTRVGTGEAADVELAKGFGVGRGGSQALSASPEESSRFHREAEEEGKQGATEAPEVLGAEAPKV